MKVLHYNINNERVNEDDDDDLDDAADFDDDGDILWNDNDGLKLNGIY